jgi:hypothetical protein
MKLKLILLPVFHSELFMCWQVELVLCSRELVFICTFVQLFVRNFCSIYANHELNKKRHNTFLLLKNKVCYILSDFKLSHW